MDARAYWDAVVKQDETRMRAFFYEDAVINWHNTNERFTLDAFIRANCEYPGRWGGQVERIEAVGNLLVTVARVYSLDGTSSYHATSFICLKDDRIASIDEYWGDDSPPPQWRREKKLGTPIRRADGLPWQEAEKSQATTSRK